MKHEKSRPDKEAGEPNQLVSGPSLEELQRSHHVLEALIATLPLHTRKELVDLLQTLAGDDKSQELTDSFHQRALQIVSDICKPNPLKRLRASTGKKRGKDGSVTGGANRGAINLALPVESTMA